MHSAAALTRAPRLRMIYAMGLALDELDLATRTRMVSELNRDLAAGRIYLSPWLNEDGRRQWPDLLHVALNAHDAAWLADTIEYNELLHALGGEAEGLEQRVPPTAARTLAEGQFHAYYIRGVCRRAIDEGYKTVAVFRAGPPGEGSRGSGALVDSVLVASDLLETLRTESAVAPAAPFLDGPNSGLSVRIPRP